MSSALASFACPLASPPNSNRISNSNGSKHPRQFISLLQRSKNIHQIYQLHAYIIKTGHDQNPFVIFGLLRRCSDFNSIEYAFKIFQKIRNRNVYLYTALIDGFVSSSSYFDAILAYHKMIYQSIIPDNYVITSVLKACGHEMDLKVGKGVHGQALKLGISLERSISLKLVELYGNCGKIDDATRVFEEMPEGDVVGSTVMIGTYMEHGLVDEARSVFDEVVEKDTVCWTAMIDGLVGNGEMNKALELFREMQRENVRPNEVTIVCLLSACSQLGALELGRWVHSYIGKYEIGVNHIVGSALIGMYSRCGSIEEAQRVFDDIFEKDVTTYNSMIVGLAMNGKSSEAIEIFNLMLREGIEPCKISFVGVLNACSHGGLLDLGHEIFHLMTRDYRITPQIEHYGCMIDLFGRVGRLEDAYNFVQRMNITPDHVIWSSLLSACKIHGNLKLGEQIAKHLVNCVDADSSAYVLLSQIYSSLGKWEEAAQARAKMKEADFQKEPGCSSIEVNGEIHEFLLGDIWHPQKDKIYRKLEELNAMLKLEGYAPETETVLQDVEDDARAWALAIHSERLALCYGLVSTEPSRTLRIVKNLRVCSDCHTVIKLITKITGRKIVVRDRKRFHHFENGVCSCGDYW
ncbi:hypothetical protein Ancab_020005 [Ancistrocladus abbreviatus]